MLRWLACSFILLVAATAAAAPDRLPLSELPPQDQLLELLWTHSPDLLQAKARLAAVRADVTRARTLPNPGLDLSVNTIPIGTTNPPDLANPLLNVPNVGVGVSELFEIGKRGPRRRAAETASDAALYDAADLLRRRYLDLLENIGAVAAIEERVAALQSLSEDAASLTELQRRRAEKGDTAALDVDRAELEEEKYRSSLGEQREHLDAALLDCSRIAGVPCEPFGAAERAKAFLLSQSTLPEAPEALEKQVEKRADLLSLARQEESAQQQLALAESRKIPDPTVRFGYVRDQFLVSGNQQNSVYVGVSLPLPFFDRGQADIAQARAQAEAAAQTRAVLLTQGRRDVGHLTRAAQAVGARRTRMTEHTLPLAKGVVDRMQNALTAGGASLQDVLLARRTLGELLVDAADLDETALKIAVALERTAGTAVPVPGEPRREEKENP